jgi:hypothetical protein
LKINGYDEYDSKIIAFIKQSVQLVLYCPDRCQRERSLEHI